MAIWQNLTHYAFVFREFLAPTYRPERHYIGRVFATFCVGK